MQTRYPNGLTAKLASGVRAVTDLAKRGAGLARGPGRQKKLNAAAWSGTWPAPGATLDLDFANNRGFVRGVGMGGAMDAVTFTRASNGTFVGSDGKLAGSGGNQGALGLNLLTFPQDFDNAAWTKNAVTVTANTAIAPNETYTADLLQDSGVNNEPHTLTFVTLAIVSGTTYTFSVYGKKNSSYVLGLSGAAGVFGTTRYANFNLATGSVAEAGADTTASITDAGNGWYRCVITIAATASATSGVFLYLTNDASGRSPSYVATGKSVFIWGAQLELGSTATTYYPTNINTPRFDWASTAQLPQNLCWYSQDFANSAWTKNNTIVTANATTAPDGTLTATQFAEDATTNVHYMTAPINGGFGFNKYTVSLYAKAGTSSVIQIFFQFNNFPTQYANFNLANGTVGSSSGFVTSIVSAGNGWYRISVTADGNGINAGALFLLCLTNNSTTANRAPSYAGNTGNYVYIWGAQQEIGASATTYLANTGALSPINTPLLPASACNGLLIEESRTNRILWCRDATQSNWTKTSVTAAKDQTGIDGVSNAASSLTASTDNATCIQTITLASGSRTGSVYLKRITGTGNVQVSLDGSTWSTVDLSSTEWRRIVLSGTVTNPVVGIRIATNGDAVAMDYAQVEDGAFATTPILTTSATATRAVDSASVPNPIFRNFYNGFGGLLYTESPLPSSGTVVQLLLDGNNVYQISRSPSNRLRCTVIASGSIPTWSDVVYPLTANGINKVAFAIRQAGYEQRINGGGADVLTSSAFIQPTSMVIGASLTGTIKRIAFTPQRLASPALVALTGADN